MPAGLAGSVECGWPIGMKRLLASFIVFLKVIAACSTVLALPASARNLSQAAAVRFLEADVGSPRPISHGQFGVDGYEDGQMITGQ